MLEPQKSSRSTYMFCCVPLQPHFFWLLGIFLFFSFFNDEAVAQPNKVEFFTFEVHTCPRKTWHHGHENDNLNPIDAQLSVCKPESVLPGPVCCSHSAYSKRNSTRASFLATADDTKTEKGEANNLCNYILIVFCSYFPAVLTSRFANCLPADSCDSRLWNTVATNRLN